MNYIGAKNKLINFLESNILEVVGSVENRVFCDIFAGTGAVCRHFKTRVKSVIANDIETYSYVLNKNYIENHKDLKCKSLFEELNNLKPLKGFIHKHYAMGGGNERMYFSDENAMKIDAIRQKISEWECSKRISKNEYFYLLASLLESADKVANTASVYGAFLKKLKKTALKTMSIEPAIFAINNNDHKVYNEDANELIKKISGDILYLDPPYNARQYGANYHLLNTIALYDKFEPRGKTGMRDYARSKYCSKSTVKDEFESLIKNADFKYIFLSYNNEGLMSSDFVKSTMNKYGKYSVITTDYQRFKADSKREHTADKTTEFLHILEK